MHLRYCSVHKSSWCSQMFLFCYLIHQFAYNCWLVHWIFGIGPVISSFLSIIGSASLDLQFVYFAAISIFEQAISAQYLWTNQLEVDTRVWWFIHWPICGWVGREGRDHLPAMQIERASNSHYCQRAPMLCTSSLKRNKKTTLPR